ncbi:family 43 glycosylhydrolase [Micromonospora sp. LOL_021]|uniref:family 43 glycosylhydrolase n=1 Tax=Micromonospora sp. LOL_021 TaxID=3345417 RepID=UPI003A888983
MTYEVNRRALLHGGLGFAAAGLTGLAGGLTAGAGRPDPAAAAPTAGNTPGPVGAPTDAQVYRVPTIDPIVEQRADPFVTYPVAGMYYFTGSVPEYDRIVIRGASTIAGLATATETVIWRRPASGRMGGHIWAPELHRIDGKWYVYFAAGDSDNVFRIRMYVLESPLDDPRDPAGWQLRGQIVTEWDSFALDATTFHHHGRRYLVWAQGEPEIAVNSSLYIAELADPWTLKTKPVRIATPTRPWEVQGYAVNEGAAVIVRNGRVFMTFSASATDSRYCMGLLTADASADLLDHRSWTKTPEPVFVTNEQTSRYGPGHNSFTVAEDGKTTVLVYHARDYRDITGDPLYDPNRHARVQKLYWDADGNPLFGVPVGEGGPIVRLSPADTTRSAFVRHVGATVLVDTHSQRLADTQFRIGAGLAGADTVSIQSVDLPGHYLRAVDGTVRLDPVADDAEFAAQASFHRIDRVNGRVSLRLAGVPSAFVRHEDGQLTIGPAAGAQSAFRLS